MIKLTPVENNDKKLFHKIAINKKIKNSHCTGCKEDKGLCDACNFGNRGKMLGVEPYVFKRYDLYLSYKSHLDSISQEDIIDEDTKELIRESYKSSKLFVPVKKKIQDNLPQAIKGKCPFCMISEPNTLEHYLLEAKYPEYIIFVPNLVPCCSQCNSLISTLSSEFYSMMQDGKETTECISIVEYRIKALRRNRGNNDWKACILEACVKDSATFEQIVCCTA